MTPRGLLCNPWSRVLRHRPVRVWSLGWRCSDCSALGENELQLTSDDGYVHPDRKPFERDPRYVRSAA